jgi:hypothetical protein
MDAQVDARLGDSILYKLAGQPASVEKKAFLLFDEAPEGFVTRDQAKQIVRLKIRMDQLPRRPSINDRISTDPAKPGPQLKGEYRPLGPDPIVAGRYWLVDLQKA